MDRQSTRGCVYVNCPETRFPITLRADFYAHCANYIDLREALAKKGNTSVR